MKNKKMVTSIILMSILAFRSYGSEFLPTSFSAQFDQEYVSAIKGKIKKGHGKVDYRFPGQIRFETDQPSHVLYLSNGKKTWYYTYPFIAGEKGDLKESTEKGGDQGFIKFFDSLKKGLVTNSLYEVNINSYGAMIVFTKDATKEIFIKKAQLVFSDKKNLIFKNLISVELEFNDGKKSTMHLSDLKLDLSFPADYFAWKL